jgi:tryptophan halogenase
MKKIIIIGGGTAGWITALLTKQFYPLYDISVIESEEIGILGAGEGTVPHFIEVLEFLNISTHDLIKNAEATLKLGIRFKNWHGDESSYYHTFGAFPEFEIFSQGEFYFLKHLLYSKYIGQKIDLSTNDLSKKLIESSKVPFYLGGNSYTDRRLSQTGHYALHFNASKLAVYLKELALSRNIKRVEGKVTRFIENDNGEISTVVLENGQQEHADFVFDCSGFARLCVGKHYNTKWVSYKDSLPLDTALPFFLPQTDNIEPVTEAIAMKYGWVWKIPTQSRYGCGYVYDSSYITEDEALLEVEEYFKTKINSPRKFKFDAGSFEKTLVKNSMAVGLAQSFVEPLEATSIWVSCLNIIDFLQSNGIENQSQQFHNTFNDRCLRRNQYVLEFLYLHYMTTRTDSKFWTEFREKNRMPDNLQHRLEMLNNVHSEAYPTSIFSERSHLSVADGLRLLDNQLFYDRIKNLDVMSQLSQVNDEFIQTQIDLLKVSLSHQDFLNF